LETSPYFLAYMNEALNRFANNELIVSICTGYAAEDICDKVLGSAWLISEKNC